MKYEMWIRRLEGRFHSLVGLSGSCFAIRNSYVGLVTGAGERFHGSPAGRPPRLSLDC